MARFIFTENYNSTLERIEDHIFASTQSLEHVGKFLDEHDAALNFVAQNPATPAVHPVTGNQSWIFGDGRYRLFFKIIQKESEVVFYLTHLIDNREANLSIYPGNKIPTYPQED